MIPEKADIVRSKCHSLVQIQGPAQIREVASVVGLMVSSFAGVYYRPLFYRSLENIKTDALQANGWDLEGKVTLSPLSLLLKIFTVAPESAIMRIGVFMMVT